MKKKIFFGIILFALSFLFLNNVSAADIEIDHNAELDRVCKLSKCIIPTPTLVNPNHKIIKINQNFYLTGLTWNNTKIDIFIDNNYQGPATVVKDLDSDTANFYFLVKNKNILKGKHEWKVIAWSENMWKRSHISATNTFIIQDYFPAPILDKITKDIDHNNWLIGKTSRKSLVQIYLDDTYQGSVQTNGNFNYNLGILKPGTHKIYAFAQDINSQNTSKKSKILFKKIEKKIQEQIDKGLKIEQEKEIKNSLQKNKKELQISAAQEINDNYENQNSPKQNNVGQEKIQIAEIDNQNTKVNIAHQEIELPKLAVNKSIDHLINLKENINSNNTTTINIKKETGKILQNANPGLAEMQMIKKNLSPEAKEKRNRQLGLWLLLIITIIVIISKFLFKNKNKI